MKNEQEITIDQDALTDLLAKTTNNPIADEEIPEMLRNAIRDGATVLVTDSDGKPIHKLSLGENGAFLYN